MQAEKIEQPVDQAMTTCDELDSYAKQDELVADNVIVKDDEGLFDGDINLRNQNAIEEVNQTEEKSNVIDESKENQEKSETQTKVSFKPENEKKVLFKEDIEEVKETIRVVSTGE